MFVVVQPVLPEQFRVTCREPILSVNVTYLQVPRGVANTFSLYMSFPLLSLSFEVGIWGPVQALSLLGKDISPFCDLVSVFASIEMDL
jgi:hypothetical protein